MVTSWGYCMSPFAIIQRMSTPVTNDCEQLSVILKLGTLGVLEE